MIRIQFIFPRGHINHGKLAVLLRLKMVPQIFFIYPFAALCDLTTRWKYVLHTFDYDNEAGASQLWGGGTFDPQRHA